MRQSTTHRPPDWANLDRQCEAERHPDKVRVEVERRARLDAIRRDNLQLVVGQLWAKGRMPRVCRYALCVGGHEPTTSLDAAATFAARHSWQVGLEQTFTDPFGSLDPAHRTGWRLVRRQVSAGYVDGVVTTSSVISPNADEYERELLWFELHCAFVSVVTPGAQEGRL